MSSVCAHETLSSGKQAHSCVFNQSPCLSFCFSMGRLYSLELEDFKSFKGKHLIGPFRQFSAIVGPNGSGKSNLMDAISFVLGEKSNNLRVRKLGDLIHGASVNDAKSKKCNVTMSYLLDDDKTTKTFSRSVVSSTAGEFKIDNVLVSQNQYRAALEEINIFIKAKNFLVYQGAVEQIAMQSPKELTQLFEELSRSSEFQEEYDRLRSEVDAAESNAQSNLNKRRDIALEKREAKQEAGEAKKYTTLKEELAAKNRELYMVQLYFVEFSRNAALQQLEALRDQVGETCSAKIQCEKNLSEKQLHVKNLNREMTRIEHKVTREDRKVAAQEPVVTQLKQQMGHIKSKRTDAEKKHLTAQKIAEDYSRNVSDMKEKMEAINAKKQQLNLNPEQVAEYRRLKTEFEKKSIEETQNLDNKRQEQLTDQNAKEAEIEREKKNIENLKETEKEQKEMLANGKISMVNMEKEVRESKERLEAATLSLQEVTKQIADAHGDTAETERQRRQNEAIESLKRVFPEKVHGRLVDLCQPSHKRFQVAVTKILSKYMIGIVCDTGETARECISYLREQHYGPETFLPLSTLDVQPLNEKLREISNPPNVKLCYDVINCNLPIARKALQFVCGNSLVCDTPEHARHLAYGNDRGDRHRAVALDGTQFQPNGVISGGGMDLKARARTWDDKAIKKLKEKRTALQEECSMLHRTRRRELDVEIKRNQLTTLEARIKSTRNEYNKLEEHVNRLQNDLEAATGEINIIEERIRSLTQQMAERCAQIEKLEESSNRIADDIYRDFCANIGIRHIREYEQREMKIHEENSRKMNEFERELDRLRYELEYLQSEDKKASVQKSLEKIEALKTEQKQIEKRFADETAKLVELEESVEELKKSVQEKKTEVEAAENEVVAAKKELAEVDQRLHSEEKGLIQQEQIETRRAQKRHSLLHDCKLHGIEIPLEGGSLDAILLNEQDSAIDDSQPGSSSQSQSQSSQSIGRSEDIKIDYSGLTKAIKKALQSEAETNKVVEKLTKSVQETEAALSKMAAPSTHVNERMDMVKEKEQETSEECEAARKKARVFEPVSQKIDEIYKLLSQNASAQAFLGAQNLEEPYTDGIVFSCIAPGKRFRPMDSLSGGEKTIAALALLFAIHSSNPSPFFVLDEIDAALDNTNIGKVVNYINERSRTDIQLVVISLKEEMYNKADALIGVFPKSTTPCIASGILTFDLENFNPDE
uniref:Structural maintenance of chromosomes protein n=1 Tax=Ditylenchus dipsaci TaxID=166011 RepID=A0A915EHG8_9BILA